MIVIAYGPAETIPGVYVLTLVILLISFQVGILLLETVQSATKI